MKTVSDTLTPTKSIISSRGLFYFAAAGLFFFVVVLFGLSIFISSGSINGEEFCPETFQVRRFEYSRIPWTQIRLAPTLYSSSSAVNGTFGILKKLKTVPASRWDVIEVRQSNIVNVRDPHLLVRLLSTKSANGASYWEEWTVRHDDLAILFWPMVQRAAIENKYRIMPDLFDLAERGLSPIELESRCQALLDSAESSDVPENSSGDDDLDSSI